MVIHDGVLKEEALHVDDRGCLSHVRNNRNLAQLFIVLCVVQHFELPIPENQIAKGRNTMT